MRQKEWICRSNVYCGERIQKTGNQLWRHRTNIPKLNQARKKNQHNLVRKWRVGKNKKKDHEQMHEEMSWNSIKKNTTPYAIREIYEQRTALVSSATLNSAKYSIGWAIQRLCQNNGIIGACSLAFWHYMHNTSGVYVHL